MYLPEGQHAEMCSKTGPTESIESIGSSTGPTGSGAESTGSNTESKKENIKRFRGQRNKCELGVSPKLVLW